MAKARSCSPTSSSSIFDLQTGSEGGGRGYPCRLCEADGGRRRTSSGRRTMAGIGVVTPPPTTVIPILRDSDHFSNRHIHPCPAMPGRLSADDPDRARSARARGAIAKPLVEGIAAQGRSTGSRPRSRAVGDRGDRRRLPADRAVRVHRRFRAGRADPCLFPGLVDMPPRRQELTCSASPTRSIAAAPPKARMAGVSTRMGAVYSR